MVTKQQAVDFLRSLPGRAPEAAAALAKAGRMLATASRAVEGATMASGVVREVADAWEEKRLEVSISSEGGVQLRIRPRHER